MSSSQWLVPHKNMSKILKLKQRNSDLRECVLEERQSDDTNTEFEQYSTDTIPFCRLLVLHTLAVIMLFK
jgi:hypothetical protein